MAKDQMRKSFKNIVLLKHASMSFDVALVLLVCLMFVMTACEHYKPMDFPPQNGEQPKPGLLSGSKGHFELPLGLGDATALFVNNF